MYNYRSPHKLDVDEALDATIYYWEKHIDGNPDRQGDIGLCAIFINHPHRRSCEGCPVAKFMDEYECMTMPFLSENKLTILREVQHEYRKINNINTKEHV